MGVKRLRNLGFNVPKDEVTPQQAAALNKVKEELTSTSDITKADNIEMQEIMKRTVKSMEDLIAQFEGEETLTKHKLIGLDKELRRIRGLLRLGRQKRFS